MTSVVGVVGQRDVSMELDEAVESCTREGESPVVESEVGLAVSRVARATWNPV